MGLLMPLKSMNRYISLRQVLDNILDHPMLKEVSFERAVNYTVHFLRIVGCPRIFKEKTALVEINNYRGMLPCDYDSIIQVREYKTHKVFRYSTDSFHMSENKQDSYDLTYKVQGSIIFTSIKEGTIEIAYNSFEVDSEGYPMIPDNSSFIMALEGYIKKKYFTILFDMGKISPAVFNQACQDYAWAVGQAQSDLVRPTIDQLQSFTNSWNTLIQRTNEHSSGFKENGTRERIKLQ